MLASTGVESTLSYRLYSLHYTSLQFVTTSLFASAFSTNRVLYPLGSAELTIMYNRVSLQPPTSLIVLK